MYKSQTNPNTSYEVVFCATNKHKFGGTKMVLRKVLKTKKKLNLFLFKIPYTKFRKTLLYIWKPIINSPHKDTWVFIKNNFKDYNDDVYKIRVEKKITNKFFIKILEQIKKDYL